MMIRFLSDASNRGFFSLFIESVRFIDYAQQKNWPYIIDWSKNCSYSDPEKFGGSRNAWEYFFSNNRGNATALFDNTIHPFVNAKKLWHFKHYKRLHQNVIKELYSQLNKSGDFLLTTKNEAKDYLGVHIRRTDHHEEVNPVGLDNIIQKIIREYRTGQYKKVFVATDDQLALESVKLAVGPQNCLYHDVQRSSDGSAVHRNSSNGYELGREALLDVITLSNCRKVILCDSNFSYAVLLFNPEIKHIIIRKEKSLLRRAVFQTPLKHIVFLAIHLKYVFAIRFINKKPAPLKIGIGGFYKSIRTKNEATKIKHRVYIDFPKTGLGNLLLVWARAKIFGQLNAIPVVASNWWGIRPGSWLRNETRKRMYLGYFRESKLSEKLFVQYLRLTGHVLNEPPVEKVPHSSGAILYRFCRMAVDHDLFKEIRPYRQFIKVELEKLLHPRLKHQLVLFKPTEIAVHIRRGDFKIANPVTPNSYFIDCIRFVRAQTGRELSVTVFTDAWPSEVDDILQLPNVKLAERKTDILDLLLMSRSSIIVLSQSSTFSYWAAFLSEAIIIKPFGDWQDEIRPLEINKEHFEGKVSFDQSESLELLAKALKKKTW